jgi:hypothetical protein
MTATSWYSALPSRTTLRLLPLALLVSYFELGASFKTERKAAERQLM